MFCNPFVAFSSYPIRKVPQHQKSPYVVGYRQRDIKMVNAFIIGPDQFAFLSINSQWIKWCFVEDAQQFLFFRDRWCIRNIKLLNNSISISLFQNVMGLEKKKDTSKLFSPPVHSIFKNRRESAQEALSATQPKAKPFNMLFLVQVSQPRNQISQPDWNGQSTSIKCTTRVYPYDITIMAPPPLGNYAHIRKIPEIMCQ